MAILKYINRDNDSYICMYECERDKATYNILDERRVCFFTDNKTIKDILNILGINDLSECEKESYDTYILSKEINPYIMKINWKSFIYFGDDMPVVKSKTVKSKTKHYMFWNECYGYKQNKPETYFYVDVKEPNKLFAFHVTFYDFVKGERILEFNEKPNSGVCPERYRDYIAKFDFSDELYQKIISEKIKKELAAKKQREEYARLLEERKRTPGYCSCCGSENAHLTVNPFNVEYYSDFTPVWLCNMCYESYLGDI